MSRSFAELYSEKYGKDRYENIKSTRDEHVKEREAEIEKRQKESAKRKQEEEKQKAESKKRAEEAKKPAESESIVNPWVVKKPPTENNSLMRKTTLNTLTKQKAKNVASEYAKKTAVEKEQANLDLQKEKRETTVNKMVEQSQKKADQANKANEIRKTHNNKWEPSNDTVEPITREEANERYNRLLEREQNRINATRQTLEYERFGEEHPVVGTALSGASNLASGLGLFEVGRAVLNDEAVDPNSKHFAAQRITQALRSGAKENIDSKAGQIAYDLGTTIGDMVITRFATGPLGSLGYSAAMAAQAASATAQDGAERGLSNEQIVAESVASAALTAACEKIGFDKVFKPANSTTAKGVIKNVVTGFLAEGSEEATEEASNIIWDALIAQDQSTVNLAIDDYIKQGYSEQEAKIQVIKDIASQVGQSFAMGGAAGGVISGFNSTLNYADNRFNGVDFDTPVSSDANMSQNTEKTQPISSETAQVDNIPIEEQNSVTGENTTDLDNLDEVLVDESEDNVTEPDTTEPKTVEVDGFTFEEDDIEDFDSFLNSINAEKPRVLAETISTNRAVATDPNATPEQRNTAQSNVIKAEYDAEAYSGVKGEITERKNSGMGLETDILIDPIGTKVSAETQAERKIVEIAKNKFGRTVQFVDDIKGSNGVFKDGIIYISRKAESLVTTVFGHEFVHTLEGTTEYRQLLSHMKTNDAYLKSKMQEAGVDWNGLVELKKSEYASALGKQLSTAEAEMELIADAIGSEFFSDYDTMLKLATQNRSVFQRLKQWFERNFTNTITKKMSESKAEKQTYKLLLRAEQAAKITKATIADEKYSLVGVSEDGRKIYKTNYPKGTPKAVKQQDLVNLVQNVWSKKPITLTVIKNGNPQKISAQFNPELGDRTDLAKIAFGNRKGTNSEKRMTLDLSSDFYQIAEDAQYIGSKNESGKYYNPAHNDVFNWDYFITNLVYQDENGNNIDCYMNLDVKQNPGGHWFYSFAIEKGVAPQTLLAVVTEQSATTPIDSIYNVSDNVKSSAKKSDVVKAIAEDYGFSDTGAQKLVSVASSIKKSAGSKADLNELAVSIASAVTKAKDGTIADADIDSITKLIADNALTQNTSFLEEVSPVLDYLKNSKISISQSDIADLGNAFSDVRRRAFPYTNIAKEGGTNIDELYQDLSAQFPEWFNAEENTHPADQLNSVVGFIEYVKDHRTVNTYAEEDAYLNLRNEIATALSVPNESSSSYVTQLVELCKRYGELKNTVPVSTDGTTRVRRAAASVNGTEAVQGNADLRERFAKEVVNGKFNYEVQLQGKEAVNYINAIKSAPDVAQAFEIEYQRCYDALAGKNPSPEDVLHASALLPLAAEYLTEDNFINYTSLIVEVGTRSGQIISALRYIGRMTGAQRLKMVERKVAEYNQKMSGKYADDKPNGGTFDENGQMQEDSDDLDPSTSVWFNTRKADKYTPIEIPSDLKNQLVKAKTQEEADAIIGEINDYISSQMKYSFWDKLNAWRYFAMLSNPKTWIKNFVGNTAMLGVSRVKDVTAAVISKPTENLTKRAVGKGFTYTNPQTASIRKSAEAKQAAKVLMASDDTIQRLFSGQNKWSGKSGMQLMQQQNALSNTPVLRNLVAIEEKALSDEPFRLARAKSVLAQSIHANIKNGKIKDLDQFMRVALDQNIEDVENRDKIEYKRLYDAFCKVAASEGDQTTFRDENKLINDINKLKQNHKIAGALVEGAAPFLKTPANIVKRGLEYNPLGLVATLTKGTVDLKNGKIDANQYVNSIAKGLTGSATMALGAVLGSLGLLSAGNDDEEDEALRKLENSQEYALNIGDISITLDWLSPAALSLFSGVKLAESIVKMMSEDSQFEWKDLLSCANVLLDVIGNTADPMFNLTMLDGIDGAIESISIALQQNEDGTGAAIASLVSYCAENWLVQLFPSITSALARTMDDTVRTYYTDKNSKISAGAQSFITTVKKKIPGATYSNAAYLDIWGQPKSSGNVAERAAENFVTPFYIEKKTDDEATKAIQQFAENNDMSYSEVMPKNAKNFTYKYNGETINLTQAEYEKMSAAIGEAQKQAVEKHLVRGVPVEIEYTYTDIRSSLKSGKSTKKATFKGNLATARNTKGWNETDQIEYNYKTDPESGEQSKKAVGISPASDEDFRAHLYDEMMKNVAEQAKEKTLYEIVKAIKNKE